MSQPPTTKKEVAHLAKRNEQLLASGQISQHTYEVYRDLIVNAYVNTEPLPYMPGIHGPIEEASNAPLLSLLTCSVASTFGKEYERQ